MLDRLERKIGKYAIPNLMNYLVGGYVIGYILYFGSTYTSLNMLQFLSLEPYQVIYNFQIWRIFSWVLMVPQQNIVFAIIMIIFYWQLGRVLEQAWGVFKFNVYIFGGMIFTIIGAFVLYGIVYAVTGTPMLGIGNYFSTYYINMSIFLAFACCFPDMEIMLYFLIPIKMKWMGLFYAVLVLFEFIPAGWPGKVAIIASLLNFIIFFFSSKSVKNLDPREIRRKANFRRQMNGKDSFGGKYAGDNHTNQSKSKVHKCATCGRTEQTNPELQFRYCSKCNGNYEYCNDHIFTHTHVK